MYVAKRQGSFRGTGLIRDRVHAMGPVQRVPSQPHARPFSRMSPLSQPQIRPERIQFRQIDYALPRDSPHLHRSPLTRRVAGPVAPLQAPLDRPCAAGQVGQGDEAGLQWGIGVKVGKH